MICRKCGKRKATVNISSNPYCQGCFLKVVDKRIRKTLRVDYNVKIRNTIMLLDDNSAGAIVLKNVLDNALRNYNFKVLKRINKSYNKIVIPATLEDYVSDYLGAVFRGKGWKKNKKEIFPLRNVLDAEAEKYCMIKKLKFSKKERDKYMLDIIKMLDNIEKSYPGVKFSMMKSIMVMEKL
ncbi:hypothetical protein DRJ17_02605 [Candidatus Woesearchaeota archaeon]|nr:MAG: hypothetical protein DRJ17_02605 [Candidatus Woesearchaeota archaeon]